MSGHRALADLLIAEFTLPDPGDDGTITVDRDRAYVPLVTEGASEARSLSDPPVVGCELVLFHKTDGGDVDVTAVSQIDNSGNTILSFAEAGDWVKLVAVEEGTSLEWRIVGGEGVTGSVDISASNVGVLDSAGLITATNVETALAELAAAHQPAATAGVGITGTADSFVSGVTKVGSIFKTEIVIEVDGLNSGGTINDIIGADGAGVAHLGQITAARNGTIFAGSVKCLEVPTGGDPDIDLWAADEATGVEDTLITDLTETQLTDGGDFTAVGEEIGLTAFPAANQYLYLATGAATDATYTAGILVITLWGK